MREIVDRLNAALEDRYRIERELGQGGMATVYLAEDLRHDRQVAIKVLKPELAAVVGAERFLTEIKTTAQLQHPHILPLHDSGEADGFLFYVMPYVEGESLRERLDREQQLPVEAAVELTQKVADALDHAHERGVVHRDVKPANILLGDRGEPRVSDFGIALALSEAGDGRITETGLSLGTPHYMSPEQASGDRTVDRRTDVYALGCVLYEMLVGEPPYAGPTAQAVLGKILTAEPGRVREARRTVPANVDAAVAKAIQKTPADRFGTARALSDALADPSFRLGMQAETGGVGAGRAGEWRWRALAALGAVAIAAAAFLAGRGTAPEPDRDVARFGVDVPEEVLAVTKCCGPAEALSPDGQWLVFVGVGTGSDHLYRRRLGELEAEVIPGTEGGSLPFFSPDSRWVGFFANGRLLKAPMAGGPPVPIVREAEVNGASWAGTDVIVYAVDGEGLFTVPAAGGEPTPVPGTDHGDYVQPWALPGGDAALVRVQGPEPNEEKRVAVVDLRTGQADTLGIATRATYASGHLVLSAADGTLLVQPFDPGARRATGQAVALLDGVSTGNPPAIGEFALSADGGLVYQTGGPGPVEELMIRREDGVSAIPLPEPGNYEDPAFSPDGRRIAVRVRPEQEAGRIWIWDRDQRTQQLLTGAGDENRAPVWTPDGSRIAFASPREGRESQIYWRPADGSSQAELLLELEHGGYPTDFSPDGGSLVFTASSTGRLEGPSDIGLLDIEADTLEWLVQTDDVDDQAQVSPDGRWLAYASTLSGQPEVYVQPLEGTAGRTQVSAGGGHSPRWAPDGATLYYTAGDGRPIIAASLRTDGRVQVTGRAEAFPGPADLNDPVGPTNWDLSPDGTEVLYVGRPEPGETERFVWILNWPEILRGMGAGGRR